MNVPLKYPVYQPYLNGNEQKYVQDCLQSSWISSKGEYISKFEKGFGKFIGSKYTASVSNGTVAIHLALIALGIGEGDEVIVPTFTYIASANPILQVGATPVFVDSDEKTWQMSPGDIQAKITPKTRAIIAVHLYGGACDMDAIVEIARKHDIFVIEDCAEAIGTKWKGKHVGTFGDIGTFSFFGNKTITTGEGGMVTTNDNTIYERMVHFKGQGLAKYREYWHDTIGFNYRMTNIQAAIGLAQLEQINSIVEKKQQIASWYEKHLKGLPVQIHAKNPNFTHSYWMVSILCESPELREDLREHLRQNGVETRPTFYPIHTMPMYAGKYAKHHVAENIASRGMNLPSYPNLNENDVKFICDLIGAFLKQDAEALCAR